MKNAILKKAALEAFALLAAGVCILGTTQGIPAQEALSQIIIPAGPHGPMPEEAALLWALNQQEASGRQFVRARHEPRFYEKYLKANQQYEKAGDDFGVHAISSSYGPWQIMYSTAVQMGYEGPPQGLSHAFVSLPYVLKYLRRLHKEFNGDIKKIVSAYNAGPGGVGTNPRYTKRVLELLSEAPAYWSVYGL